MKALQLCVFIVITSKIFADYTSLQNYINEEYLEFSEEEIMISGCVERLIHHYTSHKRQLVLILREITFDLSVIFLSSTVRLHQDEFVDPTNQKLIGTSVIPSKRKIKEILQTLQWNSGTRFVVILPRINFTDSFFLESFKFQSIDFKGVLSDREIEKNLKKDVLPFFGDEMRNGIKKKVTNILKEFWEQRITNAVVAVPQKSKIYFYSFFPYTEYNCPDKILPILLDIWHSETKKFYKDKIQFFPNKTEDLFKCPLNVSLMEIPPGIMKKIGAAEGVEGIEGEMISHIFVNLNATPVYRFVDLEKASLNESMAAMSFVLGEITHGISDMGAGLLIPTIPQETLTDSVNFGLTVCLTWAAPNQAKQKDLVSPILEIFSWQTWLLLFGSLAASVLIFWLLNRPTSDSVVPSFLKLFESFLGNTVKMPGGDAPRIFLLSFFLYAVVINTAFQAGLGRSSITWESANQFDSMEEIVDSGFEITGADSTAHLFEENMKYYREDGKQIEVRPMEILQALKKVGDERRTVYIGLRLAIRYYSRVVDSDLREKVHIHRDDCLVQYHPFLALRKNSPFTQRVNVLINRLVEGGFKDKLSKKFASRILKSEKTRKKSRNDFFGARGALIILMFGLGLSFTLFLCELALHYLYRWNRI